tara:strand:- start:214 stop:510 length:297 start_codon:yes stop_codon:yes gene_type:complete
MHKKTTRAPMPPPPLPYHRVVLTKVEHEKNLPALQLIYEESLTLQEARLDVADVPIKIIKLILMDAIGYKESDGWKTDNLIMACTERLDDHTHNAEMN